MVLHAAAIVPLLVSSKEAIKTLDSDNDKNKFSDRRGFDVVIYLVIVACIAQLFVAANMKHAAWLVISPFLVLMCKHPVRTIGKVTNSYK